MESTVATTNDSFIFAFEETHDRTYAIVSFCIHAAIIILVLVGNGIVIAVYCTNATVRRVPFNRYILSLAIADFMVGLMAIPQFTFQVFLRHGLILSDAATVALEWTGRFPILLSVFVIILITYDRLQLVKDPIRYQTSKSGRRSNRVLVFVWIFSAVYANIYAAVRLFSLYVVLPREAIYTFSREDLFLFILLVEFSQVFFAFLLPLALIILMNGIFLYELKKNLNAFGEDGKNQSSERERSGDHGVSKDVIMTSRGNGAQHSCGGTESSEENGSSTVGMRERKLRNIAKNLLILVVVYLVCWIPINVMGLLYLMNFHIPFPYLHVSYLLMYSNSAVNPFLYVVTSRAYKQGMQKLLCRRGTSPSERVTWTQSTAASNISTKI